MELSLVYNDVERENEGESIPLGPWGFPTLTARVKSSNSKAFQQTAAKLRAALKVELARGGEASAKAQDKIARRCVMACVDDIEGFTKDGVPITFAQSGVRELILSDDPDEQARVRDLYLALQAAVGTAGQVDRIVVDDAGKEPSPPSEPG